MYKLNEEHRTALINLFLEMPYKIAANAIQLLTSLEKIVEPQELKDKEANKTS